MPQNLRTTVGQREERVAHVGAVILSRAADNAPSIEGHGALFNTETVIGGYFREVIAPGAFKESISKDDIRVSFNHSANAILGRTSAKTATVAEDGKGLKYTAIPPDTQAGRDTVTSIKRGDITGSSFQFEVENDDDESWDFASTKQGKLPLRTIKRAKLYEVGPVAFPAYDTTTVSARAQATVEEARTVAEAEAAVVPPTEVAAAPVVASHTTDDRQRHLQRDLEKAKTELRCCMDSYYGYEQTSWMAACRYASARCLEQCASCIAACAAVVNDPTAGASGAACLAACRSCLDACTACLTACAADDETAAVSAAAACQVACETCAPLCTACALVCATMPDSEDAMACMSECQYGSAACTRCLAACAARPSGDAPVRSAAAPVAAPPAAPAIDARTTPSDETLDQRELDWLAQMERDAT